MWTRIAITTTDADCAALTPVTVALAGGFLYLAWRAPLGDRHVSATIDKATTEEGTHL